jgi:hypothetical protein
MNQGPSAVRMVWPRSFVIIGKVGAKLKDLIAISTWGKHSIPVCHSSFPNGKQECLPHGQFTVANAAGGAQQPHRRRQPLPVVFLGKGFFTSIDD